VHVPLGDDAVQETEGGKVFQVAVPNRDEGNAVVMDLMEMALGPAELVQDGDSLTVSIGPLTSKQDMFDVRDYLGLGGYAFKELDATDAGAPPDVWENEAVEPEPGIPDGESGGTGNVENATGNVQNATGGSR
jgi:hypothetical protein